MEARIRLLVAVGQRELVATVKNSLQHKPTIEMIISVDNPSQAENKLNRQGLNVLLMDVDAFPVDVGKLQAYHSRYQLLVLFTSCSAAKTFLAGKSGADDFILRPAVFSKVSADHFVSELDRKLDAFVRRHLPPTVRDLSKTITDKSGVKLVAIASSTGGTDALEKILRALPVDIPPMMVVQHMPSGFTKLFADRLNATHKQEIREAQTGDYIKRGQMLVAPADRHMRIKTQQGRLAVECFIGEKIHGVMPAADVLFESVADTMKASAVGVILTGMGADGARGLMKMHNAGAKTIGQDETTCVVYGMPKVAKGLGAVDYELPILHIADKIMALA